MPWTPITDLNGPEGLGVTNPRIVGDNLVVDRTRDGAVIEAAYVVGNTRGPVGVTPVITVTVSGLAAGASPTVTKTGTAAAPSFALGIPKGDKGDTGSAPNLTATAAGLAAGASPTVSVTGTNPNYTLNLGIPKGDKGDKGDPGNASASIQDGVTGTTTTWSSQKSVDSFAPLSHSHAASAITSGTISAARLPTASTVQLGVAQLATDAETTAGTLATKTVTPAGLATAYDTWQKRGRRPDAVFIGSSNVVAGTWTGQLCTAMGWTERNFAVSGGAFTGDSFYNQMVAAAADSSFANSDVGWVFVADCSNDVRAKSSTQATTIPKALQYAKTTWPNARIIVLPLVWPSDPTVDVVGVPGGWQGEWPMWLMTYVEQIRVTARSLDIEVIEHTETWLLGHPEWMSAGGDVHANAAGYTEIARMVRRYLRGEETCTSQPMTRVTADPSTTANVSSAWVSRENTLVTLRSAFGLSGSTTADAVLGWVPEGMRPMEMVPIYGHAWGGSYSTIRAAVYPNGSILNLVATSGAYTLYGGGSWRAV